MSHDECRGSFSMTHSLGFPLSGSPWNFLAPATSFPLAFPSPCFFVSYCASTLGARCWSLCGVVVVCSSGLNPMFLPSTNKAHPHPSRGEGHLVGYALEEPAHIPHERGGADGGRNIPGGLKQAVEDDGCKRCSGLV